MSFNPKIDQTKKRSFETPVQELTNNGPSERALKLKKHEQAPLLQFQTLVMDLNELGTNIGNACFKKDDTLIENYAFKILDTFEILSCISKSLQIEKKQHSTACKIYLNALKLLFGLELKEKQTGIEFIKKATHLYTDLPSCDPEYKESYEEYLKILGQHHDFVPVSTILTELESKGFTLSIGTYIQLLNEASAYVSTTKDKTNIPEVWNTIIIPTVTKLTQETARKPSILLVSFTFLFRNPHELEHLEPICRVLHKYKLQMKPTINDHSTLQKLFEANKLNLLLKFFSCLENTKVRDGIENKIIHFIDTREKVELAIETYTEFRKLDFRISTGLSAIFDYAFSEATKKYQESIDLINQEIEKTQISTINELTENSCTLLNEIEKLKSKNNEREAKIESLTSNLQKFKNSLEEYKSKKLDLETQYNTSLTQLKNRNKARINKSEEIHPIKPKLPLDLQKIFSSEESAEIQYNIDSIEFENLQMKTISEQTAYKKAVCTCAALESDIDLIIHEINSHKEKIQYSKTLQDTFEKKLTEINNEIGRIKNPVRKIELENEVLGYTQKLIKLKELSSDLKKTQN